MNLTMTMPTRNVNGYHHLQTVFVVVGFLALELLLKGVGGIGSFVFMGVVAGIGSFVFMFTGYSPLTWLWG